MIIFCPKSRTESISVVVQIRVPLQHHIFVSTYRIFLIFITNKIIESYQDEPVYWNTYIKSNFEYIYSDTITCLHMDKTIELASQYIFPFTLKPIPLSVQIQSQQMGGHKKYSMSIANLVQFQWGGQHVAACSLLPNKYKICGLMLVIFKWPVNKNCNSNNYWS